MFILKIKIIKKLLKNVEMYNKIVNIKIAQYREDFKWKR